MYYEERWKHAERIGDYDLGLCLEENPQDGFDLSDIKTLHAVVTGENDGDNWHWLVEFFNPVKDKRYAYITGGCDYTGWGCQDFGTSVLLDSPVDFIDHLDGDGMYNGQTVQSVKEDLLKQLADGMHKPTFHEETAELREQPEGVEKITVEDAQSPPETLLKADVVQRLSGMCSGFADTMFGQLCPIHQYLQELTGE